jgi:hypothetical protein
MERKKLSTLKAKKAALEAQIRREEGRERSRLYKLDTRRKILAGAAALAEAEQKPEYKAALLKLLGRFLTKPQDRDLFGLTPLPQTEPKVHDLVQPDRGPEEHGDFAPVPATGDATAARL